MDGHEFVRILKHEAVDEAVRITLQKLESPRLPQPLPESDDLIEKGIAEFFNQGAVAQQRKAAWFRGLGDDQQATLVEILNECTELSALSVCALLDGVGGPYEGTFELQAVDAQGRKTRVNAENSEMLHDLLSDVCEEDRRK
jgi:hypothetical protein